MAAIAQVQPMTSTRALRGPFDYRLPASLDGGAVQVGTMLVVPFGRRQVLGVVVGLAEQSGVAEEKLLAPVRALELGVPADLVALAEWIEREYCSTRARALGLVLPPDAARRLGGRARRLAPPPRTVAVGALSPAVVVLTREQGAALEAIEGALEEAAPAPVLLHGVTGSGKTEVYLRAAARTLEQGRGVIVLVPEIALTPQIVARFVARFGETVAVLHSQLRPAQRYSEWRRLREGRARVCVGPRSAVFAPMEHVGLVVVDEEHDASYKHEGDPRYDAREVAAERARRWGALLLLGSATPRPESAARTRRALLPARVDGGPLPQVSVLDMRGHGHGLHPLTAEALAHVRAQRGKAIVLLNRRGWSNFLSCRSCGRVWSCPECDVALVLHMAARRLSCHHCGHGERVPENCDECGSTSVARHGAGTERLAHHLQEALGGGCFPVVRLDADTISAGGAGPLLAGFGSADCGVLLGTQMVAKGHDFPDVSLGVVLDADATLRFPDFRAEERTFALIAQLAGRVGRGGRGHVLVQTLAPHASAIAHAARHDSEGFLAAELKRREALRYPPYSQLIRITCSAEDRPPAHLAAAALRQSLAAALPVEQGVVLGPAALFRLRGREREVLLIKASQRRPVVEAAGRALEQLAASREHAGVHFSVDVDPQ
jgi:primosomal protein N' (replication factor Y)